MYNLTYADYTNAELVSLLSTDRTVSYEYELLDKDDVVLGKITATGSIDYNAEAAIKRAASLNIREEREIDFLSERVKPYMCLKTSKGTARFPLGVFLMSSPSRRAGVGIVSRAVECYDKTQILSDDKFDTEYYIQKGTNYISAVGAILSSANIKKFSLFPTTLETAEDIQFEVGTSKLEAINSLLNAINYNKIYVDSVGEFKAEPYRFPEDREATASYVTNKKSIVCAGAEEQLDTFSVPNKIVRYLETADRSVELVASAVNNDPNSRLSIINRGRTITDVAPVYDVPNQETLDAYVQRLMAESKLYQKVIFNSANMPMHEDLDCLYLINKDLDISGKYIETAWHMELKVGGTMKHICKKAVSV